MTTSNGASAFNGANASRNGASSTNGAHPEAPTVEGVDPGTALISQLVNELYGNSGTSSVNRATLPVLPRFGSTAPARNEFPIGTNASGLPPVHPPEAEVSPHSGLPDETSSGGAGARDSHAFGEPKCYAKKAAGGKSGIGGLPDHTGGGGDGFATPAFYFLRDPGSAAGVAPYDALGQAAPGAPLAGFDIERIRKDFPALHQNVNGKPLIWLDNAATTQKPQSVIDATSRFYAHDNSNIHRAAHAMAARATEAYEGGREKIRRFLGAADAREIVFVRGTTEAINLVAQTYGKKNIGAGDEILLTTMEHHANIVPWQMLAEQTGAIIRVAPINDKGELILEQFASLLSHRTKLVSITHVANALGTINPLEQIISLAHAYGVPVLVDGAQSSPHMPINVQALDADFFALSGHKIFGPTGIGVLYGKLSLLEQMPPYQGGGNMIRDVTFAKTTYQDPPQRFEAGTQDIAGAVGLGAAAEYLMNIGMPAIAAYEHELLVYATEALRSVKGLRPIGTASAKASVLSFVIDGFESEQVGKHLDKHGIAVRSGHHCAQPALRRFGLNSSVRPSLAFYNTHDEIDALVRALHQVPRR